MQFKVFVVIFSVLSLLNSQAFAQCKSGKEGEKVEIESIKVATISGLFKGYQDFEPDPLQLQTDDTDEGTTRIYNGRLWKAMRKTDDEFPGYDEDNPWQPVEVVLCQNRNLYQYYYANEIWYDWYYGIVKTMESSYSATTHMEEGVEVCDSMSGYFLRNWTDPILISDANPEGIYERRHGTLSCGFQSTWEEYLSDGSGGVTRNSGSGQAYPFWPSWDISQFLWPIITPRTYTWNQGSYEAPVQEVVTKALSNPKRGADYIVEKVLEPGSVEWVDAETMPVCSVAWNRSSPTYYDFEVATYGFSANVIRLKVKLSQCFDPENDSIKVKCLRWPRGGSKTSDGKVTEIEVEFEPSDVKKGEDDCKELEFNFYPQEGYHLEINEVLVYRECTEGSDSAPSAQPGPPNASFSLGSGKGTLEFQASSVGEWTFSPQQLQFFGNTSGIERVENTYGVLQQVMTSSYLIDIVAGTNSLELRYYPLAQVGSKNPSTGKYTVSGTAETAWKINASGSMNDGVRIQQIGGGNADYVFSKLDEGDWSLSSGSGSERKTVRETSVVLPNGDIEETSTVALGSGSVSSKTVSVYRDFPWGRRLISEVIDPEGEAKATSYTYYDNATTDGASYTRLKSEEDASGQWSRYTYDSKGRKSKIVTGYLDGGVASSDSESKVTEYVRSNDDLITTTIERIAGEETSRRYFVREEVLDPEADSVVHDIVCVTPGALINDPSNLKTTTTTFETPDFRGKVKSVVRPDGTGSTYSYSKTNGALTTVQKNGAIVGGNVVSGTETTIVEDSQGHVVSTTTKDITSGVQISSSTVTSRDPSGRPLEILYDDGTTEEYVYGCCGVESSTDREGITTTYSYDSLQREVSRTSAGITEYTTYDSSGRVKTRSRKGSSGATILIETNTYNGAGELISTKDALNRTMTYAEMTNGAGQAVHTTTHPDLNTTVETRHKDGRVKEIAGTGVHPRLFEYGTTSGGLSFVKEIKVGQGGSQTEWVKTYSDMAGRTVKVEYPDGAIATSFYDTAGNLVKQIDPDGVTQLFTYDAEGNRSEQILDIDGSGTISAGDRRTKTLRSVIAGPLIRNETQQWQGSGYVTVSITESRPNGSYQKSISGGLETVSQTTSDGFGGRTTITTFPDGSTYSSVSQDGRTQSEERKAGSTILSHQSFEYDALGRLKKQIDGRVGTQTVFTYDNADQVLSKTIGSMVTTYGYNSRGQVNSETLPGSDRTITRTYAPTGELLTEGGTATYPITYTYDPQGRMRTMVTSSGATTWSYSPARGWLDSKADAQDAAVGYTYTPAGRLKTRTWARGMVTTYSYNGAGELSSTSYSDGTPSVTISRDERGLPVTITDAGGSRTLTYNSAGQNISEAHTSGFLSGFSNASVYDALKRRSQFSVSKDSNLLHQVDYTYDGASRFATVTSGSQSAHYNYLAGSSLVSQIAFKNAGDTAMTTAKTYDALDRLKSITSTPEVGDPMAYTYDYDAAGQRSRVELANGDTWDYGYNTRGEVISGGKKQGGITPLLGYQFGYDYDNIGNRVTSTNNSRTSTYTTNSLNQYTSRTVPGYVNILGIAKPTSMVTVNDQATTRQGSAYRYEISADNSTAPVYLNAQVNGVLGGDEAEVSGKKFIAKTPETFTYDADGNLKTDGRWTYTWNGENRLIGMETQAAAVSVGAPRLRLTFAYDYMGRRISKKVEDWRSGSYKERYTMLFTYDGWNLLAETLAIGPKIRTYTWGSDLSGGTAAGGVGGLLFINQFPESKSYSIGSDGNGNVVGLFDMGAQGGGAAYEYGPFGELNRLSAGMDQINPVRFSSKFTDTETDLIYYGFRYYMPLTGRWLNRDSIEEKGGANLYGGIGNNTLGNIDVLGNDFIAVGSLPLSVAGIQYGRHMSLVFIPQDSCYLGEGQKFTVNLSLDIIIKRVGFARGSKSQRIITTKASGIKMPWEMTELSPNKENYFQGSKNVWVSNIYIGPFYSGADSFAVLYGDSASRKDAAEKWKVLLSKAMSYPYAQYPADQKPSPSNWPNSLYKVGPGTTNSNTYIRVLSTYLGKSPDSVIGGIHAGANTPSPIKDAGITPIWK